MRLVSIPIGTPSQGENGEPDLRRANLVVKRALTRRHALEGLGEDGLLGGREGGKAQPGVTGRLGRAVAQPDGGRRKRHRAVILVDVVG